MNIRDLVKIRRRNALPLLIQNKDNFYSTHKQIILDLCSDIDFEKINNILILGNRADILIKSDFQNLSDNTSINPKYKAQITNSFYFERNFEQKFDMIISFFDMNMIPDMNQFLLYVLSHIEQDGVFIGCLVGESSLINTRTKLWSIEERTDSKFTSRISPMIKLVDLNQLLYSVGFRNIITLKDDINLPSVKLYDVLMKIRRLGENSSLIEHGGKTHPISRKLAKEILQDDEKYNDHLTILSFCASFNTKAFATQIKL